MIIVDTDEDASDEFLARMKKEFDFTEQGDLSEILGVQVHQTKDSVSLSHEKYINNLVDLYIPGEANRKEHKTPAAPNLLELVRSQSLRTPRRHLTRPSSHSTAQSSGPCSTVPSLYARTSPMQLACSVVQSTSRMPDSLMRRSALCNTSPPPRPWALATYVVCLFACTA